MSNPELEYLDTQEVDPDYYYEGPYYEGPEGGADDILRSLGLPTEDDPEYKPGPRDYSRRNEGRWRLDHVDHVDQGGRSRRRRAHRARRSRKAMRAGTRRARRAARRASRR
jgi:hypothetical protein